jgi:cytochrome c oxidase subunit 3
MIAPPVEQRIATGTETSPCDHDNNRVGSGGPAAPTEPPRDTAELDPDRLPASVGAARLFTYFAIFWIVALFSTIAIVLESRWVHSPGWFSMPLPRLLYVNALILLTSSVAMECARRSFGAGYAKRCARWTFVTAMLGTAFIGGQIFACLEFGLESVRVASNPGGFFFYLIVGAHGVLLLIGIAFLASSGFCIRRARQSAWRQSALGTVALYWHFLDVLWLGLFALLFTAIQQPQILGDLLTAGRS